MNLLDTDKYYKDCCLCPRNCHADRISGHTGFCRMGSELTLAKAYRHMWEEPCITGKCGSGTVFFSGCNMKCLYCQNSEISHEHYGAVISQNRLADIFLELQHQGAENINLVTGVCFIPHICNAITISREKGLAVPIIYNSGGYESVDSLKLLNTLVDIYMPDMKYSSDTTAGDYSSAPDYFEISKRGIAEMFAQTGPAVLDENGMMKRGTLVRHMVLPGHTGESKRILRYLHDTYGNDIYISIMNQYTPQPSVYSHPVLSKKVSEDEYRRVLDFAEKTGIEKGFIQKGEASSDSFIPAWDLEGIKSSPALPYT